MSNILSTNSKKKVGSNSYCKETTVNSVDYKKLEKNYIPSIKQGIVILPKMKFIVVDGEGNSYTSNQYNDALEILYGLLYTIKMSKMGGN